MSQISHHFEQVSLLELTLPFRGWKEPTKPRNELHMSPKLETCPQPLQKCFGQDFPGPLYMNPLCASFFHSFYPYDSSNISEIFKTFLPDTVFLFGQHNVQDLLSSLSSGISQGLGMNPRLYGSGPGS